MDRRAFLRLAAGTAALPLRRPLDALAGGAPVALVTADQEGFVAVVELAGRRLVRRVATRDGPRSIEARAPGPAVVAHASEGVVTLLEGSPPRVRRVLRGFATPRYAAIAPGAGRAFVTDAGHGEVAVVDLRRGRVVTRVAVGDGARHTTLDPAGRRLWVALGSTASELVLVDVADPLAPRVVRRARPPFGAHDVAFSPSGRRVWITGGRERRIAILRSSGRGPVAILAADAAPQHVTFGPRAAYVASGEGPSLTVRALDDGRVRHRARTPFGSYNLVRRGGLVLTPSLSTGVLTVLDAGGVPRWAVQVARAAHDACVFRG